MSVGRSVVSLLVSQSVSQSRFPYKLVKYKHVFQLSSLDEILHFTELKFLHLWFLCFETWFFKFRVRFSLSMISQCYCANYDFDFGPFRLCRTLTFIISISIPLYKLLVFFLYCDSFEFILFKLLFLSSSSIISQTDYRLIFNATATPHCVRAWA